MNIYKQGFLNDFASNIFAGEKVKKLNDQQFAQVISMYGMLDINFNIREIENNNEYISSNNNVFYGKDLKAITALMYDKPRSAYWSSAKAHIYDSSLSSAVPIPMLAMKRFRNVAYSHYMLKTVDLSNLWQLDQMLGRALASTSIVEGRVVLNKLMGLGALCNVKIVGWTSKVIRYLREEGFNSRKGHYASTFNAGVVSEDNEDLSEEEISFVALYNSCNAAIRHMLTQRWVWYGNHRNSDMICDPRDWDNVPTSVDTTSNVFIGIKPKPKGGIADYYDISDLDNIVPLK